MAGAALFAVAGPIAHVLGKTGIMVVTRLFGMLLAVAMCAACFVSDSHLFVLGILALSLAMAGVGGVFLRAWRMVAALSKLSLLLFVVQVLVIGD